VRLGAAVLGGFGAVLGMLAAWVAAGSGDVAPHLSALALASCFVGLWGAHLVAKGRGRLGALLLAEALLGLGLGLGEYALIPGALLFPAIPLAWFGR
jgi:hypothetical protein